MEEAMRNDLRRVVDKLYEIEVFATKLTEIKVDPWFPQSNRKEVSNRIGQELLKILSSKQKKI